VPVLCGVSTVRSLHDTHLRGCPRYSQSHSRSKAVGSAQTQKGPARSGGGTSTGKVGPWQGRRSLVADSSAAATASFHILWLPSFLHYSSSLLLACHTHGFQLYLCLSRRPCHVLLLLSMKIAKSRSCSVATQRQQELQTEVPPGSPCEWTCR
jgi:hypothetical protein